MARRPTIFTVNKFVRFALATFVVGLIGIFSLFIFYAKDLPQPGKLTDRELSLSTRIFDRNGKLLFDIFGNENRTYVPLSEISPYLPKATIAVEDKEFFQHEGFSVKGYLRVIRDVILYHRLTG